MTEVWLDVITDENYQVSNLGRVKSKARKVNNNGGIREIQEKILKPFVSKTTGYLQVNLSKRSRQNVHRLVAFAFVGGFCEGFVVNHLNGNKKDNRAENLEWVTQSENHLHAYHSGLRDGSCKNKFSGLHPTSKAVVSECLTTGNITHYESGMDAVREGFNSSCISRCCRGLQPYHKGRKWEYAKPVPEEYKHLMESCA